MAAVIFRREERIGLGVAVTIHAALLAALMLRPAAPPPPLPERISVTLAGDVTLRSTSPTPQASAAADAAPLLGAPAPVPAPAEKVGAKPAPAPPPIVPKPAPVMKAAPIPIPKPVPKAVKLEPPKPVTKIAPQPKPAAKPPVPKPSARPDPIADLLAKQKPVSRPVAQPAPASKPASAKARPDPIAELLAAQSPGKTAKIKPKTAGASRIDSSFINGIAGAGSKGSASAPPTQTVGPEVKSALSGAISRQIKPHWVAPQGADAEQLVTILTWSLNPDGTLAGPPHVLRQEGITESNRPQAPRHAEQAIRAVQLAAPFQLPPEYYDAWKRVASFRFDRKLSQ